MSSIKWKEILAKEYKKCVLDITYFTKKYCWIQTTQRGKVKFNLYDFQEKAIKDLQDHPFVIINKSRQMGISTLMAAYILWLMNFFPDRNILVIATTQNTAKNLVTKVRIMYDYLPDWLKVNHTEHNKLSLELANGSRVEAVSSASDAARSTALSMLVIDEAAFINGIEEIWTAASPTLATGGRCVLLSTPNGCGSFFYNTWKEAREEKNNFYPIELNWTLHPSRDDAWAKEELKNIGPRRFAQEYACVTGNTLVTVLDRETNEVKTLTIEQLYKEDVSIYKILTPDGFKSFEGVKKVSKNKTIKMSLMNGRTLIGSLDHKVETLQGLRELQEIRKGDLILTDSQTYSGVVELAEETRKVNLYDLLEVEGNHLYFTNGIVSHNCDFIASGDTVLDSEVIEWYKKTHVIDPIEKRGYDKSLWIWEDPDYLKKYLLVADVARGDGKDYSACHVFDVLTMEQVAEYKGQMPIRDYGHFLVGLAHQYNQALLVIENTGVGFTAIQPAIDKQYPNLYYSFKEFGYLDVETFLLKGHDLKDKGDMVPGFSTTTRTRPWLISKLESDLRSMEPIFHSERFINELRTFVWTKEGKAQAERGQNDDLVLAAALGLWVKDTHLKLQQEGMELHKHTLEKLSTQMKGVYNASKVNFNDPYKMRVGGSELDLRQFLG